MSNFPFLFYVYKKGNLIIWKVKLFRIFFLIEVLFFLFLSKSHREIVEIATYRNNVQKLSLAQTHSKFSLIYPTHLCTLTSLIGKGDFLLHSKNVLKPTFSPGCKNK